jgi:hypothetical protein
MSTCFSRMERNYLLIPIALILLAPLNQVRAQNLETISLKKGVTFNGAVDLNTVGYSASGIPSRRDPFSWFLTGGLNFDLFGYSAPFSFSYSNTSKSYSQPFNQFHFAPQYKWIKTYTGNSSMTFSPYTLAGHMFFGGGVELTPGKWRIAAMYGRLRKAVPFSLSDTLQHSNAAYKRMGYGLKVGYETNGEAVGFSLFTAKDTPHSLPYVLPGNTLTPHQNVALSINGQKKLFTSFFVNVEYGISVLNTNVLANAESGDSVSHDNKNLLQGLLPQNSTNRYFDAINTSIGYQGKQYTLRVQYERIAPEYQTLGAYYFNNDMRNVTVVTNAQMFKNKVTFSTNLGLQTNNLDNSRASTSSRLVGALNVQVAPGGNWNMAANYSNFSSYTKMRPASDPFFRDGLDTLNFYQVSETMGGSITYGFGKAGVKQGLSLNGSYQKATNAAAGTGPPQLSGFLNGALSYSYSFAPANFSLAASLTASTSNAAEMRTTFFGPSINASKSFFKMLKTSYSTSYNQTSGAMTSPVWNNQISLSYAPPGKGEEGSSKSNFRLGINVLRILQGTAQQPAFTELTATFNYSVSF